MFVGKYEIIHVFTKTCCIVCKILHCHLHGCAHICVFNMFCVLQGAHPGEADESFVIDICPHSNFESHSK